MIKKYFYIFSFTVLGALIGLLIYGLAAQSFLIGNHSLDPALVWVFWPVFALFGLWQGIHWWDVIYVHKAYLKWPKRHRIYKFYWTAFLIIFTISLAYLLGNIKA